MRASTTAWIVCACILVAWQAACGSGNGSTISDGGYDAPATCVECTGAEPMDDAGAGDTGADLDAGCPESWYGCPYPDGGPRSGTICRVSDLYDYVCEQHGDCPDMAVKHDLVEECADGCHDIRDGLAHCMDPVTSCPSVAEGTAIFTFEAVPLAEDYRQRVSFSGTPALGADGTIYIGNQGARFYALNCDGTQKWDWACACAAQAFEGSPAIGSDGTIYIGDDIMYPDYLFALDSRGKVKWQFISGGVYGAMDNSPALGDDGTIYIGQSGHSGYSGIGGFVLALNPAGEMKAGFPVTTGAVFASMAFANGRLFVTSLEEGEGPDYTYPLRAITPDGTIIWETILDHAGSSIAVGASGVVYLTTDDARRDADDSIHYSAYLAGFEPVSGAKVWEAQVSSTSNAAYHWNFPIPASPVIGTGDGGDEIYVMLNDGRLVKVVVTAGVPTIAFDLSLGYIGTGAPVLGDDGYVYAVARAGTEKNSTGTSVYKVSRDGTEVKEITSGITEMPSTSLTIASGGALLFGTEEGKVYAIQTGATGLDTAALWPTFRHDVRNTGNASTK